MVKYAQKRVWPRGLQPEGKWVSAAIAVPRRGKSTEPEEGEGHQNPENDPESAVKPDKPVEDALAGQQRIPADLHRNWILKQTGRDQKNEKGQAVLGDDIRPPDQLPLPCASAIQTIPGPNAAPQPGKGGIGFRPYDMDLRE